MSARVHLCLFTGSPARPVLCRHARLSCVGLTPYEQVTLSRAQVARLLACADSRRAVNVRCCAAAAKQQENNAVHAPPHARVWSAAEAFCTREAVHTISRVLVRALVPFARLRGCFPACQRQLARSQVRCQQARRAVDDTGFLPHLAAFSSLDSPLLLRRSTEACAGPAWSSVAASDVDVSISRISERNVRINGKR